MKSAQARTHVYNFIWHDTVVVLITFKFSKYCIAKFQPRTKYSNEYPKAPAPIHTSSTKVISSALMPSPSVSIPKSRSIHLSFHIRLVHLHYMSGLSYKSQYSVHLSPTFSISLNRRHICGTISGLQVIRKPLDCQQLAES